MKFVWNCGIFFCVFMLLLFSLFVFGKCESRPKLRELRNQFSTDVDGHDDSSDKSLLINDQDLPGLEIKARPLATPKSFAGIRYRRSVEGYSRDSAGPPGPRYSPNNHTSLSEEGPGETGLGSMNNIDRICRACRHRRLNGCIRRFCIYLIK
ncbi:hypothetical protein LOTGIDRAFT_228427 [Lottia gigantea]|uniref:Insulin-like domain-containing protein n=1 Tax=Lottia gigantea TaxID=225164 RepID=V4ASS6_LOTGI|nr:hypothetical protein LOTGIDRAFT_228427 [Lottia gigantea]ESO97900.1 hypothetical protein LOTGIDRAFT_228427 [Lottia gigantea]